MEPWRYSPAADIDSTLPERFRSFPREPHLWMYVLRFVAALVMRTWVRIWHRLEIHGAEHLPQDGSFVLVCNHQSHLDMPCLGAALPISWIHRAFPAVAADYFFNNGPRSAFFAIMINALPFEREGDTDQSLQLCRELLQSDGNILMIFPEGTRSQSGSVGRFRSGIGRLVEGSDVLVVPCHLDGAHRAFPKGAVIPRPVKLKLRIGEPRDYSAHQTGRETVAQISRDLESAVRALGIGAPSKTQKYRARTPKNARNSPGRRLPGSRGSRDTVVMAPPVSIWIAGDVCDNPPVTNNDTLRRVRYAFDFSDSKMMQLFELGGREVSRAELSDWLKRDDNPDFQPCSDVVLATFLNGLIVDRRGRREGPQPEPETRLNNNLVLTKIKIALSLRSEDLVEILQLAAYGISQHELSAFFRRPGHRQFRECQDQILRRFLQGLQIKYRNQDPPPPTD